MAGKEVELGLPRNAGGKLQDGAGAATSFFLSLWLPCLRDSPQPRCSALARGLFWSIKSTIIALMK